MSQLHSVMEAERLSQRSLALRRLLANPLALASDDAEGFAAILAHRTWLSSWFEDHPGWRLAIDPSAGFARLHKVPGSPDPTRGARVPGRPLFDRRRYTLLCLLLAACEEAGAQTTLASLARVVAELSSEGELPPFDATASQERRAFVEALRLLSTLGALRMRDGDAERYVQTQEGDALYDVNERVLAHLLSSPIPPTFARGPEHLLEEARTETEEGERLRYRQHAIRRLLDDPVLYFEDLGEQAFEWVDHSRGFLYRLLEEEAGFSVERRAEGLAAIDPAGTTADTSFPDGGSTPKHAAILLAEQLAKWHRKSGATIPTGEITRLTRRLHEDYGERCFWSKQYPANEEGCARLAAEAMELLESFYLVSRSAEGWRIRPAIARFRPGTPTRSPSRSR